MVLGIIEGSLGMLLALMVKQGVQTPADSAEIAAKTDSLMNNIVNEAISKYNQKDRKYEDSKFITKKEFKKYKPMHNSIKDSLINYMNNKVDSNISADEAEKLINEKINFLIQKQTSSQLSNFTIGDVVGQDNTYLLVPNKPDKKGDHAILWNLSEELGLNDKQKKRFFEQVKNNTVDYYRNSPEVAKAFNINPNSLEKQLSMNMKEYYASVGLNKEEGTYDPEVISNLIYPKIPLVIDIKGYGRFMNKNQLDDLVLKLHKSRSVNTFNQHTIMQYAKDNKALVNSNKTEIDSIAALTDSIKNRQEGTKGDINTIKDEINKEKKNYLTLGVGFKNLDKNQTEPSYFVQLGIGREFYEFDAFEFDGDIYFNIPVDNIQNHNTEEQLDNGITAKSEFQKQTTMKGGGINVAAKYSLKDGDFSILGGISFGYDWIKEQIQNGSTELYDPNNNLIGQESILTSKIGEDERASFRAFVGGEYELSDKIDAALRIGMKMSKNNIPYTGVNIKCNF